MQKPRKLLIPALTTFILWYFTFAFLFDFDFVYSESRVIKTIHTVLREIPIAHHLDRFIDPTISMIRNQNIRLSRPFDILFFPSFLQKETIPRYRIEVSENDLNRIENAVKEALRQPASRLTDEYVVEVPARFFHEGIEYDVEIQLRGDSTDHWKKYHKKSWKVLFRNPRYFQNHHIINLIIPESRRFFDEELSAHVSRKLELPTKNSQFVQLSLNGQDVGIYYQTEQFNKNFLERRGMPEGNLYGDRFGDVSWSVQINLLQYIEDWKKMAENPTQDPNNFGDLNQFLNQLRKRANGDATTSLSQLIDSESFTKWSAHSVLMGSTHQDIRHNMKLYFNPTTGLVEFLPDDARFFPFAYEQMESCQSLDLIYNEISEIILLDPKLLFQRNQIVWKYLNNDGLSADQAFLKNLYNKYKAPMRRGLRVSTILQFEHEYRRTLNAIASQYNTVRNLLQNPPQPTVRVQKDTTGKITVDITFSGPSGFDIVSIIAKNKDSALFETVINERILPEFDVKNKSECIPYKQTSRTYTVNCATCSHKDIATIIKNATTDERIEPQYVYE